MYPNIINLIRPELPASRSTSKSNLFLNRVSRSSASKGGQRHYHIVAGSELFAPARTQRKFYFGGVASLDNFCSLIKLQRLADFLQCLGRNWGVWVVSEFVFEGSRLLLCVPLTHRELLVNS